MTIVRFAKCQNQSHYSECHYAEWCYAECLDANALADLLGELWS
jgi:hypothetical protein